MATLSQVRTRALRRLGVVGVGVTPTGAQDEDMKQAYSEVYAELEELNLTEWAEDEDVPTKFADTISNLVASKRLDEYGVSSERYQRIMSKAANSEAEIRRLIAGSYVSEPTHFKDY